MPRPDRHNEIEINLLRSGSLTYLLGGRRETIQPGRLVIFWAAIPHQIVASREVTPYYVITLPLAWFLAAGFPAEFRQHLLHGGLIADAAPQRGDEEKFGSWTSLSKYSRLSMPE